MPTGNLCQELLKHYQSNQAKLADKMLLAKQREQHQQQQQQNQTGQVTANNLDEEYLVAKKRRVAKFVRFWMLITREHFFQQQQIQSFLTVSSVVFMPGRPAKPTNCLLALNCKFKNKQHGKRGHILIPHSSCLSVCLFVCLT